jgi:hypothetical protein
MDRIPCFSCPEEYHEHAVNIATVPHKDGGGKIAFGAPLCKAHSTYALIAGWNPIHPIDSPEGQMLWNEHGWKNPAAQEPSP